MTKDIEYNFQFKTKPFKHQLDVWNKTKDLKEYAIFFQQRLGKTKLILDTVAYLFLKNEIKNFIIIAPNGVHIDWVKEAIPEHLSCESKCCIWDGNDTKKKENEFYETLNSKKLSVFSFNYDCFVSKKRQELLMNIINNNDKSFMVLDESHKIKNPSALRTKFLLKISPFIKYKRILSGTPVANGIQDLYTQFKFLNVNILGLNSFYAFRNIYCIMGGFEGRQILGSKNENELKQKIQPYYIKLTKKEVFDLPEKIYQKIRFDLTSKQREMYDTLKKECILLSQENLKDNMYIEQATTKMIKMQQIISGFYINEENKKIEIIPEKENPKLLVLDELLKALGKEEKCLIWTKFNYDADLLCNYFKDKCLRYDGKINQEERTINKQRFKTEENIKYLIINIQTGAEGITLPEASNAIFFTNSFSFINRDQAESRNHDINSKKNVSYFDIVCNDTLDSKILSVLQKKQKIGEELIKTKLDFFK